MTSRITALLKTTLVTAALMTATVAAPWSAFGAEKKIGIKGSSTVGPVAKAFAGYFMAKNSGVTITVSETGSGAGAKSLINGNCDIAAMSRYMKEKEYQQAVKNDILPCPHVVAMDGIAVAVHPSNPVSKLTMKELKHIYTGKITNWKELGGPDKKIVKISRDTSSGTYGVFVEKALDNAEIHNAEYVQSNGAARARISKTPAAIGYVGLGFLEGVKAVKLNGVKPTMKTVGSGRYPLARPLFMWTDGFPDIGGVQYRFIMLHKTDAGKQMIKDIGFVPISG